MREGIQSINHRVNIAQVTVSLPFGAELTAMKARDGNVNMSYIVPMHRELQAELRQTSPMAELIVGGSRVSTP